MIAARPLSRVLGLAAVLAILVAGCEPPPPPEGHNLSGKVTYDGKEVVSGEIYFTAKGGQPTPGPKQSIVIENGKYTTAYTRQSAPVGPTHVLMQFVVDDWLYIYEGDTELPPSPGTKDFILAKDDAKRVPKLAAPGGGGGGGAGKADGGGKGKGGKGKGRRGKRDKDGDKGDAVKKKDSDTSKDSKEPAKTDDQKSDDKKADEKKSDEKKSDDKKADDKKTSDAQKPDEKKSDDKKPDEKKGDDKSPNTGKT